MIRRDRPADEIEEIEVTPAMVEAGLGELRDHRFGDDLRLVLEDVYRSMTYAKRSASSSKPDR